jgi:hypothetical protein
LGLLLFGEAVIDICFLLQCSVSIRVKKTKNTRDIAFHFDID